MYLSIYQNDKCKCQQLVVSFVVCSKFINKAVKFSTLFSHDVTIFLILICSFISICVFRTEKRQTKCRKDINKNKRNFRLSQIYLQTDNIYIYFFSSVCKFRVVVQINWHYYQTNTQMFVKIKPCLHELLKVVSMCCSRSRMHLQKRNG